MSDKNLTIFKSSAGSGKTFTLVKEYLKLAITYPTAFQGILAVTFTNKATEEMKSRIISNLVEIINGEGSEMGKSICSEIGISESELASKSKKVLNKILHNYSDFSIISIVIFGLREISSQYQGNSGCSSMNSIVKLGF